MMAALRHEPVMLSEVLEVLAIQPGDFAVDGTLGLAGHAKEMAKAGASILGVDWDESMLREAKSELPAAEFVHADYREIPEILGERRANAILLDLGLNSAQIDDPERGISFMQDGPLDMRMDRSRGESAASFLNRASEDQIEKVIREYGEEKWSRRIAKVIVERRREKPLRTTQDLVDCILAAVPVAARDKRIHPATRTSQGVRIAINHELEDLETALAEIARCLAIGGRMVVLSYHSLEDRAVKRAFRELAREGEFEDLFRKPLEPSQEEINRNRRSRSAKLRAVRRMEGKS
ncbi:MAG: 16S rRNA (cytosine(1402)-N(4))-methyltransferase RsmH [Fimbriimonadaceae bacterium]|nr:16S rRNA (cytosine(1402)-N(4))-methyltransferase RsmH [Fimbriimonadaceae bacterium]